MKKTILITGATDGIGLATSKMLALKGHNILIHGRRSEKLNNVEQMLTELPNAGTIKSYVADLSRISDVVALADSIRSSNEKLDVLINNAGVFKTSSPTTQNGLDVRFVVNTIAPYLLTKKLTNLLGASSRVINLSSAAQASVNIEALAGRTQLSDMDAYAQSKLAITMWTRSLALSNKSQGPVMIAVNPGSMLGSKMVQEGFGVAGGDLNIGAEILMRVALDDEFLAANGKYFDNDSGKFSSPHSDAMNPQKLEQLIQSIEAILKKF
ncbi:SDR family NAD(P)-dependent oxidoreductase [Aliikangiella coralliicola]|uniref:SDR family NAD(P)-dependent oxidoreductase n=1 Tax=Aliikangiella coralliicola TaxID=2592383 RepID=A0A545UIX9_9GAMM|nr:SDR family NAD(P)-dependent oxidoreductase [Aliikangiella coralliicola]TQV89421.1 SDR family NAD(P)-dependent oxidoreductase [Aliikangiella coralliicola]